MEQAANWKSSGLIVILHFVSQINSANASMCNITFGPGNITFEVPPLKPEDYDCEYSWNNDSNVVLANHLEHHPKCLHQTITSLVISGCYNVTYKRNCGNSHYLHRCDVNSDACISLQVDKKGGMDGSSERHHSPAIIAVVAVIVVIAVIAVIALALKKTPQKTQVWMKLYSSIQRSSNQDLSQSSQA